MIRIWLFTCVISVYTSTSFCDIPDQSWDILVFTQHFPLTQCVLWKEKSPKNKCTLPTDETLWTVHGVWPTKQGAKQGPHFCNKTLKFDKAAIQPILHDLETHWLNVENNTNLYSFWKHEWMKHGTCATQLPVLDTELKYFQQALKWAQEYDIGSMLRKANVVPSQTPYNVTVTYDYLHQTLQLKPVLQCAIQKGAKRSMLSEVQLCFNRSLSLIGCDVLKPNKTGILSDCDLKKPLYYYDKMPTPPNAAIAYYKKYYGQLVDLHRIISMLIKLTL